MGISSGAAASPRTPDGMQAVGPGQMPDRVGQGPILSRMNIKRIAIATFLLCLLAACGNKGPLVMPQKPVPIEEQAVEPVDEANGEADEAAEQAIEEDAGETVPADADSDE